MPNLLISVFDLIPEFGGSIFGHVCEAQSMDRGTDCATLVLVSHKIAVKIAVLKPGGLRLL